VRSKKIKVICYYPHWKFNNIHSGWVDVWIEFYRGRKKEKRSLIFQWAGNIDEQIKWQEKANQKMIEIINNEKPKSITVSKGNETKEYESLDDFFDFKYSKEEQLSWYQNENSEWLDLQWMKEYFKDYNSDFGLQIASYDTEGGFEPMDLEYPYILANRDRLNKKTIEDGIEWYLKTIENVGKVKLNFNWKRQKIWVTPVG
jgi:hypothetical protein